MMTFTSSIVYTHAKGMLGCFCVVSYTGHLVTLAVSATSSAEPEIMALTLILVSHSKGVSCQTKIIIINSQAHWVFHCPQISAV